MNGSQINIGKHTAVSEYNANNAWIFNGTNGTLNNNNKYNNNGVRPVLESDSATYDTLESFVIPLHEYYAIMHACKKRKTNKPSYLIFYYDMARQIRSLCWDVGNYEYIPRQAIAFVITYPRLREVVAADFADRIIQTYFVKHVMPILEAKVLHEDSYACRVGKGGLKAIQRLQDYIFEESNGYTQDVWLAKIDLKGFFMSIDTELSVKMLCDVIGKNVNDLELRNMLLYLCRIIYQSLPQMHCRTKSPDWMFGMLEYCKRLLGKASFIGIAIGNVTSQMMACFITTFYLVMLSQLCYKFVHYTDDTTIVIKDKCKWLSDVKRLEVMLSEELHLKLHPNKRYLQHYSKGVEMLGYKLRFDRVLPSDRIAHNFKWKASTYIRKSEKNRAYALCNLEHFVQVVNSYAGLLVWCNAYKLRKSVMDEIAASKVGNLVDVAEDYGKITMKKRYTKVEYYKRKNKERKREWQRQSSIN